MYDNNVKHHLEKGRTGTKRKTYIPFITENTLNSKRKLHFLSNKGE